MTVRKIAVAISGIEVNSTERKEMTRSCALPSRMPASTPVTSASGIISAKTQKARMPVFVERAAEQEADIGVLLEGAAEIAVRRCRRATSRSARRRGRSGPSPRAIARSRRRVSASTAKPPSSLTASCFLNFALSKTAKRTSETTAMISSICASRCRMSFSMRRSPPPAPLASRAAAGDVRSRADCARCPQCRARAELASDHGQASIQTLLNW